MTSATPDFSTVITKLNNAIEAIYLKKSDIADNLNTNDATKVLSAKQGKNLNDLIGDAISYINQ